jgi:hypothetical protein
LSYPFPLPTGRIPLREPPCQGRQVGEGVCPPLDAPSRMQPGAESVNDDCELLKKFPRCDVESAQSEKEQTETPSKLESELRHVPSDDGILSMGRKRRNFTDSFQAPVALLALRGDRTIQDTTSSKFDYSSLHSREFDGAEPQTRSRWGESLTSSSRDILSATRPKPILSAHSAPNSSGEAAAQWQSRLAAEWRRSPACIIAGSLPPSP